MTDKLPRVGVGVFVLRDGKFIMLHRRGAHGDGTWGLVGGHLEFGESWAECAIRETREEIGCEITNIRFFAVTNDIFTKENKHYVTIFLLADLTSGEPSILEPEKCQELNWFTYDTMLENIF
jgi:8-oxo-dGTP diphosphatase